MDAAPIDDRAGPERLPGAALPRNIGSASAPGEAVEHDLDAFISRRDTQRRHDEGERAVEESWRESERREEARRADEERIGRVGVFRHLQRVYAARSLECGHAADELEGIA